MVEFDPVDTDVKNTMEDAGVVDSTILQADEDVTLILGRHVNGNPVTVDVRHFAVLEVEREMDEEEQAMYPEAGDSLHFTSVLVAAEDGEASQETVINVNDATVEDAIDGLSQVVDDNTIDVMRTANITYEYEDGELIDLSEVPAESDERDDDEPADEAGEPYTEEDETEE